MNAHLRIPVAQITAHPHYGAARADPGDKSIGNQRVLLELPPDFRTGRACVRLHVGAVGKLAGQENVFALTGHLFGPRHTLPRKPPSSREIITMRAPRLQIRSMRSRLIQSGMRMTTGWPSARPSAANAMPVFPLVASMTVWPGPRDPSSQARRRM